MTKSRRKGGLKPLAQIGYLLRITRTHAIVRRYFVVNGFDGALTMLGLIMGFMVSGPVELTIVIGACLGAAIALAISGISSAYISEAAERRRDLAVLEEAMLIDLQESTHAEAARWVPLLIALVNGLAPLTISLLVMLPLWLAERGVALPLAPLHAAIAIDLGAIFMLGVFLGRVSDVSWIRSGVQTLTVALVTAAIIYLLAS